MADPDADGASPAASKRPRLEDGRAQDLPSSTKPVAAATFGLSTGSQVLLVGEGNLSFAGALASLQTGCRLLATTYETAEEHAGRFLGSSQACDRLHSAGALTAHGVDATDLPATLPSEHRGPFDRVIFQFPQHPTRFKINLHRELLRGFFRSAEAVLGPGGEVVVSLLKGQGGTAAEAAARRVKDTWQIQDAAAEAGLVMRRVSPCPIDELSALGYERTGFRGKGLRDETAEVYQERAFNSDGSLTHCFCRPSADAAAACPIECRHDISFWTKEDFQEKDFASVVQAACGPGLEHSLQLLDHYCSPKDGRLARTYRISARTFTRAVSQDDWRRICEVLRRDVVAEVGVEPRRQRDAQDQQPGSSMSARDCVSEGAAAGQQHGALAGDEQGQTQPGPTESSVTKICVFSPSNSKTTDLSTWVSRHLANVLGSN